MKNKLPKFLPLILIAGAFVLAGCGNSGNDGPSATDAQEKYAQVDKELSDFGKQLGTSIGSASTKTDVQIEAEFTQLADTAKGKVDELKAIEVPSDVTGAKDDLV